MTPEVDRPGPIVEVEWVDSTGRSDWHEPDEARVLLDKMACLSSGYLVADTDDGIILAQGVGELGMWLSSLAIPRAAIRKITTVAMPPTDLVLS